MGVMELPYFGKINIDSLDYYKTEIELDNHTITVDLNFENLTPHNDWFNDFVSYIKKLNEHYTYIWQTIKNYYANEQSLLPALQVVKIGFYPEEHCLAVWNFTLGNDITDEQLYIVVDNNGTVRDIVQA